jgi:hypothetical protein
MKKKNCKGTKEMNGFDDDEKVQNRGSTKRISRKKNKKKKGIQITCHLA